VPPAFVNEVASAGVRAVIPVIVTAWLSTYDWWNNSPPGAGISYAKDYGYPTIHDQAGGSGTYKNPITFASASGELRPGTHIYIPWLHKYFMKEDDCASCSSSPSWQFDLWVGGVSRAQNRDQSPSDIVNLWQRETVVIYPAGNKRVNTTLLARVKI